MSSTIGTDNTELQETISDDSTETLICDPFSEISQSSDEDKEQFPDSLDEIPRKKSKSTSKNASEAGHAANDESTLSAYRKLSSRRVDLIGDYAGNELFLIDGDSLLLHCFSDKSLDIQNGLQLLHAVYAVERFLSHLQRRKCCFKIIFFNKTRNLCIPPGVPDGVDVRYLLIREVIVRHLQIHLPNTRTDLSISVFEDHYGADFLDFLQRESPYFLMLHDRAFEATTSITAQDRARQVVQRGLVLHFVRRGFNIALINELAWRDSKVIAVVLESKSRSNGLPPRFSSESRDFRLSDNFISSIQADFDSIKLSTPTLSERQILLVLTVGKLLTEESDDLPLSILQNLASKLLLHQALLTHMPLSSRRIEKCPAEKLARQFLNRTAMIAARILAYASASVLILHDDSAACDIGDFLDGRLFYKVCQGDFNISDAVQQEFQTLSESVSHVFRITLSLPAMRVQHRIDQRDHQESETYLKVLPFSNPVFDLHLSPVNLQIEDDEAPTSSVASQKIFKEVSHWHNASRIMDTKGVPVISNTWQAAKAARRNQIFMAEMRTYAASLTNAVGKSLEPETLIVGADKIINSEDSPTGLDKAPGHAKALKATSNKPKGGAKAAKLNAYKEAALAKVAAEKAKKIDTANEKIINAWRSSCKEFDKDFDPFVRYRKAQTHFMNLQASWQTAIGTHFELYMLSCLVQAWSELCKQGKQQHNMHVAALIWQRIRCAFQAASLPAKFMKDVQLVVKKLGLPELPKILEAPADRKLDFDLDLKAKGVDFSLRVAPIDFQLVHGGPFLERSFNAKADPRVQFKPDEWQSRVLDCVDEDKSVFVVAPTSAGKTFISFYAMRKILKADDDGVLVYVAPTKALVNQIAAEIQARYSKNFKHGGKSVWAIHTRDYRINNPTGCQVLVTVPHILQIMLLSPSNANSWSTRVKRIIFDEVHSIGHAEDGVVWEQLLLMAPCPIIALSATVGNPQEFGEWLSGTQKAMNNELVTVQHPHRYSDLRKYLYTSPEKFDFSGIPEKLLLPSLGLDELPGFDCIHPVITIDKSRGIPEDLALESRDCYYLWAAMEKVKTRNHPVPTELAPQLALPSIVRKVDILVWERSLKALLQNWLDDANSPYDQLIQELGKQFYSRSRESVYKTHRGSETGVDLHICEGDMASSTLALLCRLQERDALPAILFSYDRAQCEKICSTLVSQLLTAETALRKSGMKWERTVERWEGYKQRQEQAMKSATVRDRKAKKGNDKKDAEERSSHLNLSKENGSEQQDSKWDSFDPNAPSDGFHFADYKKVQPSELLEYTDALRHRDVPKIFIDALGRGIGVHHAGMNRKYRQVVEILFRKRFLRVVVATGTLALGINMPCKTTVFVADSVYLTALNYRQCAGRAGRRGFDLLGNVVFHGISEQKVSRLLSSRLPDLNGHFPLTTTLVLRLLLLLHESKNSKYAANTIIALLSQPRLYLGGESFKEQTLHHLRFSIEYLRRQSLLGVDGTPLNFAGLVTHLYYTENSSFAFHALLKEGYFHKLCAKIEDQESQTLETLMLVMAHLFGRVSCRRVDVEYKQNIVKPSSSIVFLPSLPKDAAKILNDHNEQTLRVYKAYVDTFIAQHVKYADNKLPLTGVSFGYVKEKDEDAIEPYDSPAATRSSFIALSGAGDDFQSIHDLCCSSRSGVFLEEAVIPYMQVSPDDNGVPLNAWLLDFFKHGDVKTLERANGIRSSDVWFHLNDFSLVLATIVTSLSNFLKLTDMDDADMLDVQGGIDELENAKETLLEASIDTGTDAKIPAASHHAPAQIDFKQRGKVADSWEDDIDLDCSDDAGTSSSVPRVLHDNINGFGTTLEENNSGLLKVLKAFQKLQSEFNEKFRAMWA